MKTSWMWSIVAVAVVGSHAVVSADPATPITGTATYREKVALTPDAVFDATLEDVTKADAPAEVIARIRKLGPGQVPISFEIPYDGSLIRPGRKYGVRVTIRDRGELRFTTSRAYPVLTPAVTGPVVITLIAASSGTKAKASGSSLGTLPATYTGILPCADCMGMRYQINLLPGRAYMQRTTYLRSGSDQSYYEIGAWSLSDDGGTLTLDDGKKPGYWAVKGADSLRKLDISGAPIESSLPYTLARSAMVEPMQPRVKLAGMFLYMADAARFRECRSGLSWPVEMSGDYKDLERAYTAQRSAPGAELMVTIQGRIEQRPKMEGSGTMPTLIVEEFVEAIPAGKCAESAVQAGLENTRWRPVRIGDAEVVVTGQQREPWFVLEPQSKRITGSGGCNRITGTYAAGHDSLSFKAAATLMACATMDTEKSFLGALSATRRYRVQARLLELLDGDGRVLARLEERNLR